MGMIKYGNFWNKSLLRCNRSAIWAKSCYKVSSWM